MTTRAGLWIDHRKAVIVMVSAEGEETRIIEAHVERHVRCSGGAQREPVDTRDRRFGGELGKFYDEVIACIRDVEAILIFGPGEAKGELKTRLERDSRGDRIIAIETVDKMTDRQIAARVRQRFSGRIA